MLSFTHHLLVSVARSLSLATAFLFFQCSETPKQDADPVNAVIHKLIAADNDGDMLSVLAAYTDSVEFFPPSGERLRGIAKVRASYAKLFSENQLAITTRIIATNVLGSYAFISGANKGYRKSKADSKMLEINDRYVAILMRTKDGSWKIDKLYWYPDNATDSE